MNLFFATTKKNKPKTIFKKGYHSYNTKSDIRDYFDEHLGQYNNQHHYMILYNKEELAINNLLDVLRAESIHTKDNNKFDIKLKKSSGKCKKIFIKLKELLITKTKDEPITLKKILTGIKKEKLYLYNVHTKHIPSLFDVLLKELDRKDNTKAYIDFLNKQIKEPISKNVFLVENGVEASTIQSAYQFQMSYKDNTEVDVIKLKYFKNKNFNNDNLKTLYTTQNISSTTDISHTSSFNFIFNQNEDDLDIYNTNISAQSFSKKQ